MERLYTIYDNNNVCTHCEFFEEGENPINSTLQLINGQIKPMYNSETDTIYEGATELEILGHNRSLLPKVVSQRQLRTQLVLDGHNLNDVQLAINELTEPSRTIAQIAFEYSITLERESPLLICVANKMNLSESDVDNLFLNASKL